MKKESLRRRLFGLASELKLNEDSRKAVIVSCTNGLKESVKELTETELLDVVRHFEQLINSTGAATPKQKTFLHSLWHNLNSLYNGRSMPFESFLRERYGVGRIEDLSKQQANYAIKAIQKMIERRKGNADKDYTISKRKRKCACGTFVKWVETRSGSRLPYELNKQDEPILIHECEYNGRK